MGKNMVEVRPPMTEFNEAVVAFLLLNDWESADIRGSVKNNWALLHNIWIK